jgi:hypothetical protein
MPDANEHEAPNNKSKASAATLFWDAMFPANFCRKDILQEALETLVLFE